MNDADAPDVPHFLGHRERLRDRFRRGGGASLADYELLELILFRAMPRRDVKPIAKALIARFGSYPEVLAARPERLEEVAGMGEAAVTEIKIVEAAARRLAQAAIEKRKNLGSSKAVIDYCRTVMAFIDHEEFPHSFSICDRPLESRCSVGFFYRVEELWRFMEIESLPSILAA